MINLFQPSINIDDAMDIYKKTLTSGWLGRGNVTLEFEAAIAKYLEVDPSYVHCVSSCTSANIDVYSVVI